jgi:hypothetical protein
MARIMPAPDVRRRVRAVKSAKREVFGGSMRDEFSALQQRMAETFGIADPDALRAVERAGYSADTLQVMAAAPLLEVAWADGRVSDSERLSILEDAVAMGIDGGPAYEQLLELLAHRPSQRFFDNSRQALRSALRALSPAEGMKRFRKLMVACGRIASASRSTIGRHISNPERRAIDRMSQDLLPGSPSRAGGPA